MEPRPLPEPIPSDTEPEREAEAEPALELLPALDDAEAEVEEAEESAPQTQDPLKLYVRQIGDGRLLTPSEGRELDRQ